jgi:metallo-beta-lactamase class B
MLISVNVEDICSRPWYYAVEPFKIVDRVYYIGNSWVSIYLIDTGEGLILIDTAMPQTVYLTMEAIRKLGYDPRDIKYILLTHAHYDHCGGVQLFSKYTGAKVFMGKEDMFFLTERPDLIYIINGWFETFQVDEYFEDNGVISLGDISIVTKHTPGHTPGTYSFFFNITEGNEEYRCGLHGGIGINTLTDEFFKKTKLPLSLRDDFEESLRRMRNEKVDIPLGSHTNHCNMLGKAKKIGSVNNPFIDHNGFQNLIDDRYQQFIKILS